jgi:hypothetical protein
MLTLGKTLSTSGTGCDDCHRKSGTGNDPVVENAQVQMLPKGKMNHELGDNEALTIMEKHGSFNGDDELPMAKTRSTLLV